MGVRWRNNRAKPIIKIKTDMRKILSIIAITALIFSCSSDDLDDSDERENLVLSSQEEAITIGESLTLSASASCVWETGNDFIASVADDGTVVANHVGETDITAVSKDNNAVCKIIVKGKLNTYKEPVLDFGASMSDIMEKECRAFRGQYGSERLTFSGENSIVDRVNYFFKNDRLIQVDVVILHNYSDAVKETVDEYLLERYKKSNKLDAQNIDMVWTDAYFMVNGYNDNYDVVIYHYPYAVCFGSTSNRWGDRRWSIIYTSKGRTPTTPAEN